MNQKYEATCVFVPTVAEDKVDSFVSKVEKKIVAAGGTVEKVLKQGLRKVHTNMRKFKGIKDGFFVEIDFEGPGGVPLEVSSLIRVNEEIMRFIVIKAEEKKLPPVEKAADDKVEVNPEMLIGKPE